MAKRGPASSYKFEYSIQARQPCKLGAINGELAESFGASIRNIGKRLYKFRDFKQAARCPRPDTRAASEVFVRPLDWPSQALPLCFDVYARTPPSGAASAPTMSARAPPAHP
jgi:hypothetical protein